MTSVNSSFHSTTARKLTSPTDSEEDRPESQYEEMVNDNASLFDGYEDVDEMQAPCTKIVHERLLAR